MIVLSNFIRKLAQAFDDVDQEQMLKALKNYMFTIDKDWNYVLPDELVKALDKYFIVDLRDEESYEKGHIPGAINIYWKDILDNLDKLPTDRKILLSCYVGHTASQVMVILKLLGYDVSVLKFGMGVSPKADVKIEGWLQKGHPITKEAGKLKECLKTKGINKCISEIEPPAWAGGGE